MRYDQNDGTDAAGNVTADDSKVSPRVGITWDILGDGNWQVNAGYAKYVTALANTIADSGSSAGQIGYLLYGYDGPDINPEGSTTIVSNHEAITQFFAWFNGLTSEQKIERLIGADLPGYSKRC